MNEEKLDLPGDRTEFVILTVPESVVIHCIAGVLQDNNDYIM